MEHGFPEIRKNFGFGLMRLPQIGETVDFDAVSKMVDAFISCGFHYFDTAHRYLDGHSEEAVRKCLTSRYKRDEYVLTNKLSTPAFETEADIRPLFESQLQICGVDYFDFYLFHAMNPDYYKKFTETNAFEIVRVFKAKGKIRHIGMSFHGSASLLDQILTEHPEIEVVQLQINYVDWDDPRVDGRGCYGVCCRHGKPIIVMEPVKGGSLVQLPEKALQQMGEASPASYAIRYAASLPQVMMVLSGMSNQEQMTDNLRTMQAFKPLTDGEREIIDSVRTIYQAQHRIPCTACRYCTDGCPMDVPIPDIFACMNRKREGKQEHSQEDSSLVMKADACIQCRHCEQVCPQHLQIPDLLREVRSAF